ncbi:hypothetical protein LOTGIDRAFT_187717 [Lottia gigantea]|uniref:NADPH--cytochrome P450 reductase n=1 Tax=Lottia gigantea TaxID=225164 RepID=V4AJW3_LOTGI|nr:hypothetical protein LOTGIDRAFT_187717 [Lottia gigantea]ESO97377.1 hypothetical protein LOTGIDRAFT_187717 [Lottia gigantea]
MSSASNAMAGGGGLFSMVDLFVLSAAGGFAIYWFFIRTKKQEQPTFKKLTVSPIVEKGSSSGFINKMKNTNRNVVVFYGSQTGTAEEFATRLAKDATRYGMKGMVADPEECDMEDLSQLRDIENSLVIFCLATYGEGDPTDNAQEFYDFLQSGGADLDDVKYAVFALGNKTYEHFNAMGIYVDKRLEELGAKRVYEIGLGDDDANIEEDFVTWREKFWPAVCEEFGVEPTGDDSNQRQYTLEVMSDIPREKTYHGEISRLGSFVNQKPPYDAKNPFMAPMTVKKELHKGGGRSCMHIEFDITGSKIRYESGDHVAVYPINDSKLVEKIGQRLNTDLDTVFTLTNVDEEASKKHPFPNPCSYRTAFLHYLDIQSPPRTHILRELAEYAEDPKEKEFLLSMTGSDGKDQYNEWIVKDHRNIVAILEDLKSLKPPLDHICEMLPRLQCRYYSISSSAKVHPTSIHITAVLVDYKTRTGRQVDGVATKWLSEKVINDDQKHTIPIFVRKSQFRLPFKPSTPVIMIGPGTGLAPFRGFLQERDYLKKEGKPVGDTILYFGCRNKVHDFIYENELNSFKESGALTKLHIAFSRDQNKKVYVQHLLNENKDEIWNVLESGGHIYVCGDARNMAREVHSTLEQTVVEKGNMDAAKAADYIKKLQSKGRYSCDVWS